LIARATLPKMGGCEAKQETRGMVDGF